MTEDMDLPKTQPCNYFVYMDWGNPSQDWKVNYASSNILGTFFDRSHLAHVRHVVLWQMQNFKCHSKLLCFILNLRAISEYKPLGTCIWRGDLSEGFLHYEFGGLIFGGANFGNSIATNQANYCRLNTFAGYYSLFIIKIIKLLLLLPLLLF